MYFVVSFQLGFVRGRKEFGMELVWALCCRTGGGLVPAKPHTQFPSWRSSLCGCLVQMCRACWHGLLKEIFEGWKVMATAVWKVSTITCTLFEVSFPVFSSLCAAQWGEGWKLLSLSFVCLQNPVLCRHPSSSAGRQRCRGSTVLAGWKEAGVCWRRRLGSWATRRAALWSLPEHRALWRCLVPAPRGTGHLLGEAFNPRN